MFNDIKSAFIEALFFADNSGIDSSEYWTPANQELISEGQTSGEIPSDLDSSDIDADSMQDIDKLIAKFIADCGALINGQDSSNLGHDLYFTYSGHGVGFWDGEKFGDELGAKLDAICGRGEISSIAYQDNDETKLQIYIG